MAKRKSTADRLAALERQAADIRVRAVEAGEFRLVDKTGRVRAVLEMVRNGPSLSMMHEDGTVSLEVELSKEGPVVRLSDETGRTRVFVGATRGAARLGMADGQGHQRLFIGADSAGNPAVTLYNRDQKQIWTADATSAADRPGARAARSAKKKRP